MRERNKGNFCIGAVLFRVSSVIISSMLLFSTNGYTQTTILKNERSNRFFPSLGNHDWYTAGAQPYLDYFTLPGNERYYEFTRGPVHFFAIDSDTHEPDGTSSFSTQAAWLQSQLGASSATWKLVYMHHAPFSSSSVHGSTSRMQWPYQAWGATAVLAGHAHTYERIIKEDFPYFVNGLGGASRYGFGTPVSGSQVRYSDDWGAMLIEATNNSIAFQFITRTDTVIDTYTINAPTPTGTPAASSSVRFAVIGDYGSDSQAELDVSNLLKSWNPDFIITTGDNNYPSGAASTIDDNIGQYYHGFIYPYTGSYGDDEYDLNLYCYNGLVEGDWTYWDAKARNPSPYARDLWVIPQGNDAIGMAAVEGEGEIPDRLFVMKNHGGDFNLYYYNALIPGDWSYWDARARNPSPMARDLWVMPSGNGTIGMASVDITGDDTEELAILKKEGEADVNIYYYNVLVPGDWVYWDAKARNPSPVARDLWVIPVGNDAVGMAAIDVDGGRKELAIIRREGENDLNLYIYRNLVPGDWNYWDAKARNTSPLARDLWVMPVGNDAIGLAAIDIDGDGEEELSILKKEGAGDLNIYYYRSLEEGDWTYWDAKSRNPSPLARDLWVIPSGNDVVGMTAIRTE